MQGGNRTVKKSSFGHHSGMDGVLESLTENSSALNCQSDYLVLREKKKVVDNLNL